MKFQYLIFVVEANDFQSISFMLINLFYFSGHQNVDNRCVAIRNLLVSIAIVQYFARHVGWC